jgi:hypothetical protein
LYNHFPIAVTPPSFSIKNLFSSDHVACLGPISPQILPAQISKMISTIPSAIFWRRPSKKTKNNFNFIFVSFLNKVDFDQLDPIDVGSSSLVWFSKEIEVCPQCGIPASHLSNPCTHGPIPPKIQNKYFSYSPALSTTSYKSVSPALSASSSSSIASADDFGDNFPLSIFDLPATKPKSILKNPQKKVFPFPHTRMLSIPVRDFNLVHPLL